MDGVSSCDVRREGAFHAPRRRAGTSPLGTGNGPFAQRSGPALGGEGWRDDADAASPGRSLRRDRRPRACAGREADRRGERAGRLRLRQADAAGGRDAGRGTGADPRDGGGGRRVSDRGCRSRRDVRGGTGAGLVGRRPDDPHGRGSPDDDLADAAVGRCCRPPRDGRARAPSSPSSTAGRRAAGSPSTPRST